MLMTDGTVLAQGLSRVGLVEADTGQQGSYVNGTWKQAASFPQGYAPDAIGESVLADGRS